MESPYILPYIKQRLAELGFNSDEFHYETVRISKKDAIEPVSDVYYNFLAQSPLICQPTNQFTGTKFYLLANNQFYFLVEKTAPIGLTIISDTGCLTPKEATDYSSYTFFNYKEFTGQIFFEKTSPGDIDLEFIRCTPYKNK